MKKIFVSLLILISFTSNYSQTLKGFLFSDSDRKPVEFANVVILNLPDSSYEAGAVSYTDGQYTFNKLKPGKYFINASCIGFKNNSLEIEIMQGSSVILADTIFLQEKINELSEVEVKGDLIRAKELVDRTVYEIPPELEKISTNGYDVLKKIPSVQVDFNNNITLNGKSNFIIQIDGKQRDKEFLSRILPSDIESIEIIHNPSGKYEGDIEGVINVIIKKEARAGINGNFGVQTKPWNKPTVVGFGSLDYGFEKVTFYVSGFSFVQQLINNTSNYNRLSFIQNKPDSITNLTGTGNFKVSATSINTGCDYYINDKNNMSLNLSYKPSLFENKIENNGNILLNDSLVNYQDNSTFINNTSEEINISVYYRKKFKKPIQEFTIESNLYLFN